MKVSATSIPGLLVIEPQVYEDARGWFLESFHRERYAAAGVAVEFVQENRSRSVRGTLRGLHYQWPRPQAKLVWVTAGSVFDVVVDLRCSSPSFGRWLSFELSNSNYRQLFVPIGCAHGVYALSESAELSYKCSDYYAPQHEQTIAWDAPELAIAWPDTSPLLSAKDSRGMTFAAAPKFT